jgi:hypothetical protein
MPWVLLRRVVLPEEYSELVTAAEVIIPPPQLKGKRAPPASVSICWAFGSFVALPSSIGSEMSSSSQHRPRGLEASRCAGTWHFARRKSPVSISRMHRFAQSGQARMPPANVFSNRALYIRTPFLSLVRKERVVNILGAKPSDPSDDHSALMLLPFQFRAWPDA